MIIKQIILTDKFQKQLHLLKRFCIARVTEVASFECLKVFGLQITLEQQMTAISSVRIFLMERTLPDCLILN